MAQKFQKFFSDFPRKVLQIFPNFQSRLALAFDAIEANDQRKAKSLVDEEIVQTRDARGEKILRDF